MLKIDSCTADKQNHFIMAEGWSSYEVINKYIDNIFWLLSLVFPIKKGEDNPLNTGSNNCIQLTNHALKFVKKVFG